MADPRILIDTSILIEHLRKQDRTKSILFNLVDANELYVSTVVEFELFMGANDQQKTQDVQTLLSWCTSLPLTSQIAQQAGRVYRVLRQHNQLIEIRDILIGATAMVHDLPIATQNEKHFKRIDGLQLFEISN